MPSGAVTTTGSVTPSAPELLDAILTAHQWMIRRKDFVEFETELDLNRSHSFDFEIPVNLLSSQGQPAVVPLGFWWKAPTRYTDIDLEDESGQSLPLSTSTENARLTLSIMLEYARRGLQKKTVQELPLEVWFSIMSIVNGEPALAISDVRQKWRTNAEGAKGVLAGNAEFLDILEVCSCASIMTVELHDQLDRRRVIKLRYAEHQDTYFRTDKYRSKTPARKRIWRRLGRLTRRFLGLGSYKLDLGNAFVRGRSYHFEAKAPTGMAFSDISLKLRSGAKKKAPNALLDQKMHLHEANLDRDTTVMVRSKIIVTDGWMMSAIICTVLAITVLIGIINNIESMDPAASGNVIAVALLVPSIAMSIVWRRVHRLVERLHQWLRYLFLSLGGLLFYLAFRVAESPISSTRVDARHDWVSRFTNGSELVQISKGILVWACVVLVLLVLARFNLTRLRDLRARMNR